MDERMDESSVLAMLPREHLRPWLQYEEAQFKYDMEHLFSGKEIYICDEEAVQRIEACAEGSDLHEWAKEVGGQGRLFLGLGAGLGRKGRKRSRMKYNWETSKRAFNREEVCVPVGVSLDQQETFYVMAAAFQEAYDLKKTGIFVCGNTEFLNQAYYKCEVRYYTHVCMKLLYLRHTADFVLELPNSTSRPQPLKLTFKID